MLETLDWATLQSHIQRQTPCTLPMGGDKHIRIGYDPEKPALFLRIPSSESEDIQPSPFSEIELTKRHDFGLPVLEARITNSALFFPFHQLAVLATLYFEGNHASASDAFFEAIESWRDLILNRPLLSPPEQLGLLGELFVLRALCQKHGQSAVAMWTANTNLSPGRHDFRFGNAELEVKTTRRRLRVHHINGLTQLVPSPGQRLFVLSLKFEHAGPSSGLSLPKIISAIRADLPRAGKADMDFESKLKLAKYRDSDSPHYTDTLMLAAPPHLIAVDDAFPRITPDTLLLSNKPSGAARIAKVTYEVNLEGLGVGPATELYNSILGEAQIGY